MTYNKILSPPRKLFVRGLPILLKINWKRKTQVLDDFTWQSIDQDQKVFAGRCRKFGEQKKIRLILKFVLGAPIRFTFSAGAYKGLLHCWIKVYKPSWTMWLQYQASATLNNFNQTKIMSALKPIQWTFCSFLGITYIEESSFTNYCNSLWTLLLES